MAKQAIDPVLAAERNARQWLARQVVQDGHEPELDEGDCTICGTAAGEPHEPTDVCGIVANLLDQVASLTAERDEWRAEVAHVRDMRNAAPSQDYLVACLIAERAQLQADLAALKAEHERTVKALAGLVGSSDRAELKAMELVIRTTPAPDEDKAASINAIHALLAALPVSGRPGGEPTAHDGGYAARMAAAGIETERDERGHHKVPISPITPIKGIGE